MEHQYCREIFGCKDEKLKNQAKAKPSYLLRVIVWYRLMSESERQCQ